MLKFGCRRAGKWLPVPEVGYRYVLFLMRSGLHYSWTFQDRPLRRRGVHQRTRSWEYVRQQQNTGRSIGITHAGRSGSPHVIHPLHIFPPLLPRCGFSPCRSFYSPSNGDAYTPVPQPPRFPGPQSIPFLHFYLFSSMSFFCAPAVAFPILFVDFDPVSFLFIPLVPICTFLVPCISVLLYSCRALLFLGC
jgi:hypothetical protein